ncbi:MAG: hypothetical protein H0U50_02065, partial [Pyrinomonadaceae bacterium]|nr:hypothetical protein [Pyrinomonadaceae bacterium]
VEMTDQGGNVRTARTNPFGYYRFEGVAAGETYIISVSSKHYSFIQSTRVLSVNGDLAEVDFTAQE